MTARTLLVIEDDAAIRHGVVMAVRSGGYGVVECGDGTKARSLITQATCDLVLLDLVLPDASGLDLLTQIRRERPTLPVIILTSNIGAEQIKRQTSLGFMAMQEDAADNAGIKGKITEAAKKFFKPEFLNRLDDIVIFRMLEKEQLNKIVDLEVSKVVTRLKKKNIHITLDDSAREFLMKEGFDPQYGARPMRRAVEKNIEDPLAEHLLRGDIREGDIVKVSHDDEHKRLKFAADKRETTDVPAPAETPAP